ncbi:low affinity iron permease family protein [Novosphingobium sp. SL115]|uniref:low affinity iron permease family protein n=1 Tax=Novosphingobium sp. SL115 TaxID=2995150 RepID=UPI002DD43003|nr:low affinity iron permease family protein [Novosphingobium sp. SL115]
MRAPDGRNTLPEPTLTGAAFGAEVNVEALATEGSSAQMDKLFTAIANRVSAASGKAGTFIIALTIIIAWGISGPVFKWSDTWQLVINTGTTIITFLMVFLIQNSQNRDAAAMQAKLDELLRAVDKARVGFVGIEHLTDDQISKLRDALEDEVGCRSDKQASAHETVERLLDRT